MSNNTYGVTGTPRGEYAWYDFENGEWMGKAFSDERSAQIAVNLKRLDDEVDEEGYDELGRAVVATADGDDTVIKPRIITQDEFQQLLKNALDNWDFDNADAYYAKARPILEGMVGAEINEVEMAQNIAGPDDFDGLEEWAARIANNQ